MKNSPNSITRLVGTLLMIALLGPGTTMAKGGRRYGLNLGHPRLGVNGTIAVPVRLRVPKGQDVAALNFTLRFDISSLDVAPQGVAASPTVRAAKADLFSHVDAGGGLLRTIVVPEFTKNFASLRSGRVATVYLAPRGRRSDGLRRWLAAHLRLEGVVLGDREGRELRFSTRSKRS